MRIQTTKTDLLNTVIFSNRAVGQKASSFILSGIMLNAQKNLTVYSTDLETSIKSVMKAKVLEEGRVVVPARILINILKSLKESKIELELDKSTNQVKIMCENAHFTLNTLSLEEYPGFPEIKKENPFEINLNKFKNSVSKVQKAVSLDESRAILTGVLLEIEKGLLTMAATDSYRLALIKERIESISTDKPPLRVIVPARVLDSIIKGEYKSNNIEVNIEENQISFYLKGDNNKDNIIVSRLLSGNFPEYKQLVPSNLKHNIVVKKEKILDVVKRISSISQNNIPIKLTIEKGKISVSMDIKEIGSSSEDLEVSYGEKRMEIAFNPDFLIDGINIIDGENIILSIEEPLKPILLKPEKDKNLLYLLMPIRVSQ